MVPTKLYPVPEELVTRIPGYLERRFQDLAEIESYFEMKNWNALSAVAHKIKGNGAAFGFQELTDIADEIQQATRTGDEAVIGQSVNNLKVELFFIQEFMEKTIND